MRDDALRACLIEPSFATDTGLNVRFGSFSAWSVWVEADIRLPTHCGHSPLMRPTTNVEWMGAPLRTLDELVAFDAMRSFLEAYWKRGGQQSDDLAVLLGGLSRDARADAIPLDPAQWSDWRNAVDAVISKNG